MNPGFEALKKKIEAKSAEKRHPGLSGRQEVAS